MRWALEHQLVAVAVDREDVLWFLGALLELLAQLDDEVVDRAVRRVGVDTPDLVEDLLAADRLADPLVQHAQELHLVEREALRPLARAVHALRAYAHACVADVARE